MIAAAGPADEALWTALRQVLQEAGAGEPVSVARRPSEYGTSFPLEELSVGLEGGGEMRLAFKLLAWEAMNADARLAKPRFLHDPRREPAVYASVLPVAPAGPPRYVGSVARDGGARWLFIEWVDGRELYQVGERAIWAEAARWLGALHGSLAPGVARHAEDAHLLRCDGAGYRRWIERAREFATAPPGESSAAARTFLDWLAQRYDAVVEALLQMPMTVIHGDFHAANVLVSSGDGESVRVAPVDWESAAAGPGLLDLAALLSGDWGNADRDRLAAAYASAPGVPPFSPRQLDLARLHLAVQSLGWAPPHWVPPEGQRHDWLADAVALAEGLDL